jgi:hypothetical protein
MLNGFGAGGEGEDPFDAIAGLCGMIEVADGRRAEAPDLAANVRRREGWILGQIDLPLAKAGWISIESVQPRMRPPLPSGERSICSWQIG